MVSSPSSCPPRSGSAAPPTPSRRPRSGATQPARSGERGPVSEPSRPLAFLLRNSTLLNSLVLFRHQALSTRSRSRSAPFLHQAPAPCARVPPPFSQSPAPSQLPPYPSRTCWKLPEGRVFPPNRRRSHRRGILLLPSQGEIHRGDAICSGEGGGGRLLSLVEGQASGNRVPR